MVTALPSFRTNLIRAAVIILAGLLVYYPAMNGDWLWDDAIYITGNPLLLDPARLWKAWFVPGSFIEYYPLEQTVQWVQWKLWAGETFGYHFTNVVLHLLSALLVWKLLCKFGLRWAWLGGLIFAIHPMNVESVAYISELKNTLSLPFFILSCCAFIDFEESKWTRDYVLALGFFLAAMLAKISMMTFPFVILLYVWWKRGKICRIDILRVIPFLLLSLALGATTYWSGIHFEQLNPSHPAALPMGSLASRIPLAGLIITSYLTHALWPLEPLPIYPRWSMESYTLAAFLPWLLLLAVLALLWSQRKTWGRHALLGLGFFLIMLLPFSGLVIISYMNFSWTMDHFLYIPMIGLIGLVVASLEQIRDQLPRVPRAIFIAVLSFAMLFLAMRAQDYAAVWTDPGSLWSYTVERNPQAWLAHYNLGNDLRLHKKYNEAIDQYRQAIQLNPKYDWAHNNLGMALGNIPDHLPEAIAEYRLALGLRPDSAEAHNNLANALLQTPGNELEAIYEYEAALRIKPDFVEAKYNLALVLAKTGRLDQARVELQEILRDHPGFAPAMETLGKMQ